MPGRGLWAAGAFAVRAITQAAALELREQGIHVALLIVDAGIEPFEGGGREGVDPAALADPREIADAVAFLADQGARAATHELQVTPLAETLGPVKPAYPLQTERLLLRPFAATRLRRAAGHPVARRRRALPLLGPAHRGRGARDPRPKVRATAIVAEGDNLSLAAVLRESGEMIGDCSLRWASAEHRQAEIGFVFHPDHHGHGYATEAAAALLDAGLRRARALHRVFGRLEARNTASARVLERLGMRKEAHLVENEHVKGEWQSEVVYALLEREWQPVTGAACARA